MQHVLLAKRNTFRQVMQQLDDYSPLKTLDRGFTYTTNAAGETISSVSQVKKGDKLKLHFKDGAAEAVIEEARRKE